VESRVGCLKIELDLKKSMMRKKMFTMIKKIMKKVKSKIVHQMRRKILKKVNNRLK
jgi:hypothetical protein